MKAFWSTMGPQLVMSMIYTGLYGMALYHIMTTSMAELPEWQKDTVDTLVTFLTAAQLTIINWWFSSSVGSKLKTLLKPKES
ncbi:MAG: hypothetical protein ACR2QW_10005 [bacterium]